MELENVEVIKESKVRQRPSIGLATEGQAIHTSSHVELTMSHFSFPFLLVFVRECTPECIDCSNE